MLPFSTIFYHDLDGKINEILQQYHYFANKIAKKMISSKNSRKIIENRKQLIILIICKSKYEDP